MIRAFLPLSLTVLLILGCSSPAKTPYSSAVEDAAKDDADLKEVFVVNHGWHTGIVLGRLEVAPYLPAIQSDFRDVDYLEVGWGDERFYQADRITSGLKIQAIFWPTDTVLHVVEVPEYPLIYFSDSEVVRVRLASEGFIGLATYINNSFALNDEGVAINLGEGLYGNSRFYRARGRYHVFNNCNHWTAEALQAAGLPVAPASAFTADSVLSQAQNAARSNR